MDLQTTKQLQYVVLLIDLTFIVLQMKWFKRFLLYNIKSAPTHSAKTDFIHLQVRAGTFFWGNVVNILILFASPKTTMTSSNAYRAYRLFLGWIVMGFTTLTCSLWARLLPTVVIKNTTLEKQIKTFRGVRVHLDLALIVGFVGSFFLEEPAVGLQVMIIVSAFPTVIFHGFISVVIYQLLQTDPKVSSTHYWRTLWNIATVGGYDSRTGKITSPKVMLNLRVTLFLAIVCGMGSCLLCSLIIFVPLFWNNNALFENVLLTFASLYFGLLLLIFKPKKGMSGKEGMSTAASRIIAQ